MVSKLWHALEPPGELVKNTDALTPTYRLGMSRSGRGPRYMYFLTSSQVTLLQSRFENLWHSSHHGAPLKKKVATAIHCPPISFHVQGLSCSCNSFLISLTSHFSPTGTQCWILTAHIFPCLLFTSLLLAYSSCLPCLGHSAFSTSTKHCDELELGHFGKRGWVPHTILDSATNVEWRPKPRTRDTYTRCQSQTGSVIYSRDDPLRCSFIYPRWLNNTESDWYPNVGSSDSKHTVLLSYSQFANVAVTAGTRTHPLSWLFFTLWGWISVE